MTRLLVLSALALANAVGTFLGLVISSYMGEFAFENLKSDILKCLGLGVIVVACVYGLISLAPHPYVLLVVPVIWFIVMQLLWLELEKMEILIAAVASFVVTMIAVGIASQCF
jgi:uncharacterized membrane protein